MLHAVPETPAYLPLHLLGAPQTTLAEGRSLWAAIAARRKLRSPVTWRCAGAS